MGKMLTLGLGVLACFRCGGQETGSAEVLSTAEREGVFQTYFDRMTAPRELTRFKSQVAWMTYKKELKSKILDAIGLWPLPERVPLSPVITGRLEREGYAVERVYYQVLPKVYASGYLYRPEPSPANGSRSGEPGVRFPTILNPHGHWDLGATHPTVQSRCIAEAKKGYVAFCPDSTHVADLGVGLCPIGLMTWNNMRALDYLESLDFVDPARIGCTGESGGGQQTLYLAALDERVKVIVPAVLVSYFKRILFVTEQTHCFCNHAPGIESFTDENEIAAMFAPRPALFICATGDWTRDFPKQEFPDVRHVYGLVGGDVDCVQFDKPHNYDRDSRQPMYRWMNKYLKGELDPAKATEPPITPEPPAVLKALGGPVPGASDLEGARAYFRSNFLFKIVEFRRQTEWRKFQAQMQETLRRLLGERTREFRFTAVSRGTASVHGLTMEKLLLETEPGITAPGWLFAPPTKSARGPALVVVHPAGKEAFTREREDLLRSCLSQGITVLALDPRFRGELHRNWHWNEVIWGRPEEGTAATDLIGAGAYLRGRHDVDPKQVFLLGIGETGRFALCAAALDSHWAGVAIDDVGPLYAASDVLQVVPKLLRYGDLPQIAAVIAPRPLWINGAQSRFGFTRECYAALAAEARLRCSDLQPIPFFNGITEWVSSHVQ